ncbi:MAG: hypothetical protein K8F25_10915 [Fimbriimonadaceae bacterium]|nr:hypothetical protein [Alphaproteobacteria bacterium]
MNKLDKPAPRLSQLPPDSALINNNRRWMAISAVTGLTFFLIANFTDFFIGLNVVSGLVQISINTFVFLTWLKGFRASHGRARLVAFFGVAAPPVLVGITLYRVIIPFFF